MKFLKGITLGLAVALTAASASAIFVSSQNKGTNVRAETSAPTWSLALTKTNDTQVDADQYEYDLSVSGSTFTSASANYFADHFLSSNVTEKILWNGETLAHWNTAYPAAGLTSTTFPRTAGATYNTAFLLYLSSSTQIQIKVHHTFVEAEPLKSLQILTGLKVVNDDTTVGCEFSTGAKFCFHSTHVSGQSGYMVKDPAELAASDFTVLQNGGVKQTYDATIFTISSTHDFGSNFHYGIMDKTPSSADSFTFNGTKVSEINTNNATAAASYNFTGYPPFDKYTATMQTIDVFAYSQVIEFVVNNAYLATDALKGIEIKIGFVKGTLLQGDNADSAYLSEAVEGVARLSDTDALTAFVIDCMHTDVAYTEEGTGACKTSGWYATAKAAYEKLTDDQKTTFCTSDTYAAPYARLQSWAKSNGDSINAGHEIVSSSLFFGNSELEEGNDSFLLLILSIIVVSAVIGASSCIIIKKKKHSAE